MYPLLNFTLSCAWLLFEVRNGQNHTRKKKKKTEIACDKKERQKKKTHFLVLCTRAKEREREMSYGATTRAQKGCVGARDAWDVIVNNDDIFVSNTFCRD